MISFAEKSRKLKLLTAFATVLLLCAVTIAADNGGVRSAKKEVLTTLEQRMQKRISVDFRNTPIDDVIRIMAEQADVDIVKSPKVTGNVTATLTNVPLEEVLNNILNAHGYGYVATKNMIRIAPIADITQVDERLTSRIYRITYADIIEVEKALKKFISKRGSLSSNPGTSNIIVTDTESKIKAIDTFINEIDRITPQILVEARIYDITSKDRLDLGIEWEAGKATTYAGGIGTNPTAGNRDSFMVGGFTGATGKTSGTTGAFRVGWLNAGIDVDMMIRAQQNNIDAKLLANPRILVLDNEKASIKIITEIPYQELTQTSEGGSIGTTSFREVGVELVVTPHITRDDMVRLDLKPKFSVRTEDVEVGGSGQQLPQPVVDKREADTTLLIKDGQTVVLGGLRKKDVTHQINKIPLLGDIPILGTLFKFEGEDTITSELVVFITPHIIRQSTLSEIEKKQFEVTEFSGPEVVETRAEKEQQ